MLQWLCNLLRRDEWGVERFSDVNGAPRFRIVARNGEIICSSEAYSSNAARDETADKLQRVRLVPLIR